MCGREDGVMIEGKAVAERQPVVCVDEKPIVLHADTRPPMSLRSGRVARRDYEYKRCGTANVFCGIEPTAGGHFTKRAPTRAPPEFSDFILENPRPDPPAATPPLVLCNLST